MTSPQTLFALCAISVATGCAQDLRATRTSATTSPDDGTISSGLDLAGLGDHQCLLKFRMVKSVAGAFEYDTPVITQIDPERRTGFGNGCLETCKTKFSEIQQVQGADKVLLQACEFQVLSNTAEVKGTIDVYTSNPDGTHVVSGWACKYDTDAPIEVHLYLNGAAGAGLYIAKALADLDAEEAVGKACGTNSRKHRFQIPVSAEVHAIFKGKQIFVHGIDGSDPNRNHALTNSGNLTIKD